jgi:membrane protease YdiL (CAAX protease family)
MAGRCLLADCRPIVKQTFVQGIRKPSNLQGNAMSAVPSEAGTHQVRLLDLGVFFFLTFLLAWGILGLYIFLPGVMTRTFGELTGMHPLFFLAVYAPAVAAVTIVLLRTGPAGLVRYLSRLLLWRANWKWYAFLILGIPLIFYAGAAIKGNLFTASWPFASVGSLLSALFFFAIKGPVEELGWRGLAQPLLQRRLAPFWAGLVIGLVWALWHLPAFLLSGTPQGGWSFAPFFLGSVGLAVIMTPLFNRSGGSILLAAVFHFQVINPIWPDIQPYDNWMVLAAAAVVVWCNRGTMFTRAGAVTTVVPGSVTRSPEVSDVPASAAGRS